MQNKKESESPTYSLRYKSKCTSVHAPFSRMQSTKGTEEQSNASGISASGNMSFGTSFTLYPSDAGAFGTYGNGTAAESQAKKNHIEGDETPAVKDVALASTLHLKPRVEPSQTQHPARTFILPNRNSQGQPPQIPSISMRALPCETVMPHGSFLNGTISPLDNNGSPAPDTVSSSLETSPHHIPPLNSVSNNNNICIRSDKPAIELSPTSLAPPVSEIRIPTPQGLMQHRLSCQGRDNDADDSCTSHPDYKALFFCCQHTLQSVKDIAEAVSEENRLLKRHLIQLQKQLNAYRRNKCGPAVSWTIPVNRNKRFRPSDTPTEVSTK
jgi:hypothetical protein